MLSEQSQIEAIKGALQGAPLSHPLEFFDGVFKRLAAMIGAARNKGIDPIDYLGPLLEADAEAEKVIIAATSPRPAAGTPRSMKPATAIEYPPVEWLYPGVIVRGQPNALLADGGTGKNWIGLWLANCVANGLPFCGVKGNFQSKKVLWIDAEDFFQINQARITQWYKAGMFRDNRLIYPYCNPSSGLIDIAQPHIQSDILQWVQALKPDLVVLDSWDMALTNNTFKADVQDALIFIKRVTKAYNCAWLTLCHPHKRKFTKATDPIMPDDMAGSRLFKQLHRIFWGAWYYNTGDHASSDPRVLSLIKTNYRPPETSKWVIDFQPLHPDGLRLDFQPYKMLEAEEFDPIDAAAEWVEGHLHKNPAGEKYMNLKRMGSDAGHSMRNVEEAVKVLKETGAITNSHGDRVPGNKLLHKNHKKGVVA